MAQYGILVDYDWCTGCHSCEIACQQENKFPVGQTGILVTELGPWEYAADTWQLTYLPAPTDQCNLCAGRAKLGKEPSCVQHCQAQCMVYGPTEELFAKFKDHNKQVLFGVRDIG